MYGVERQDREDVKRVGGEARCVDEGRGGEWSVLYESDGAEEGGGG